MAEISNKQFFWLAVIACFLAILMAIIILSFDNGVATRPKIVADAVNDIYYIDEKMLDDKRTIVFFIVTKDGTRCAVIRGGGANGGRGISCNWEKP